MLPNTLSMGKFVNKKKDRFLTAKLTDKYKKNLDS